MIYNVSHNETRATKKRPSILKGRTFTVRPAGEIPQTGEELDAWFAEPGVYAKIYIPAEVAPEKRESIFAELVSDLRRILIDGVTIDDHGDEEEGPDAVTSEPESSAGRG